MRTPIPWFAFGAFLFLLLNLTGWGSCSERQHPVVAPTDQTSPKPNPVATYDDDITRAQKDAKDAGSDQLKVLEAQKREADAHAAKSEQEARQWHALSDQKGVAITNERNHREQVTLYWLAGVLVVLALAATVLAIWQPMVRKMAGGFAVACIGVAALAMFVAWLIPYLIWVGAGLATLGLGAVIVWWKRDHKSLHQVVEAVGAAKLAIPEFKAGYKDVFTKVIDTDAEKNIEKVRTFVGKQQISAKKKAAIAFHAVSPLPTV